MRNFTDFMIWNHIFFIIEIFHAYYKKDYMLVFLASSTTYLSIERHRTMYTKYNMIEPIVAKSSMVYMTCRCLYEFAMYEKFMFLLSESISFFIWDIQKYNYEKIHPLLHVSIALNAGIYLNYLN